MRFVFFGGYHPAYPRSAVFRRGLRLVGAEVRECRAAANFKSWIRYPLLFLSWFRTAGAAGVGGSQPSYVFVPEFCQKDMPLARFLSLLSSKKIIFDPLASRYETKIVDWKRKPTDSPSAWWNFKIDAMAFRLADLVLADTAAHKDYYCRKYGLAPWKVEVLPLAYDDELFDLMKAPENSFGRMSTPHPRTVLPKVAGEFRALFFGSFLPLHGADVIIEAADIVAGQDSAIKFLMVGSGQTLPRVKAAASGLKNVGFLNWLPLAELPRAIEAADVCLGIFGSTEKAQRVVPHKVLQSMGMRKPVISARTPAAEEFFTHRKEIYFCDEPLPRTLAEAILELKNDATLREKIAANAHRLVREKHSPSAAAARLVELARARFG